ncbi:hypothetical protein M3Y94_01245700 [Aphelenchoides besseyi]|nr:hypothetical protein M3Y94_01245700 [Aphelenchoides besseyi]
MKAQLLAVLLVVGSVQANEWWDPLGIAGGNQNQPILAKLTPAIQQSVPHTIQQQLARVTPKDLLGLRSMAERMTQHPTSRAEFIKELNQKAPNVLFLGTEVYKVGRDVATQGRKKLSSDAIRFLRTASKEVVAAVNEAAALFKKQDVGTKKNLQSVFPFIPQLIQSSQRSVQYVAKNI